MALQQRLVVSWRQAIQAIAEEWRGLKTMNRLNPRTAAQAAAGVLARWPEITAAQYADIIDRLFMGGFIRGAADTGLTGANWGPDHGDRMVVDWLKTNPNGFVPALQNLGEDGRQRIDQIISEAYAGRDELGEERPFDLDDMVRRVGEQVDIGANRAELIVRTETAKATALGRIAAWGNDPERDWYWYHWIATPDDRTKDVSLLFEMGGPYNYNDIKRIWEVDHNHPVFVRNRHTGRMEWQTSAYNCRCTVARTPKDPRELLAEGKITQAEYERMA